MRNVERREWSGRSYKKGGARIRDLRLVDEERVDALLLDLSSLDLDLTCPADRALVVAACFGNTDAQRLARSVLETTRA
jgi:hypothetical protein